MKIGENISYDYMQIMFVSELFHSHCRPCKFAEKKVAKVLQKIEQNFFNKKSQ